MSIFEKGALVPWPEGMRTLFTRDGSFYEKKMRRRHILGKELIFTTNEEDLIRFFLISFSLFF